MRYAIIDNEGVVLNVAVSDYPLAVNWIEAPSANKGDIYKAGVFTAPPQEIVEEVTVE